MCVFLATLIADNLAIAAVVGTVWSWAIEFFPLLGTLPKGKKRLAVLGVCVAIPLTALVGGTFLLGCAFAVTVETVTTALIAGVLAFAASQVAHIYMSISTSRFVHRK